MTINGSIFLKNYDNVSKNYNKKINLEKNILLRIIKFINKKVKIYVNIQLHIL